jgi:hypothetical protein
MMMVAVDISAKMSEFDRLLARLLAKVAVSTPEHQTFCV